MLRKLKNDILDLIFPANCLNCGRLGYFICDSCRGKIIKIKKQSCPFCHRESVGGRTCLRCRPSHRLAGVVALGFFHDSVLKEAIHHFKYEGISAAGRELAEMAAPLVGEVDVFAFVPISKRRYNERGYNQAEVLAVELGLLLQKPLYRGLRKTRHTERQVGLKRRDRLKNLRGAFVVRDKELVQGKRVLLIDDVLTTGATLEECAKMLRQAGAKRVTGLVLARE